MKVRVRVSKGRPAISLRTEEAASLGSLKEELTSSRLITYDILIIIYFQNMQVDIKFWSVQSAAAGGSHSNKCYDCIDICLVGQ